MGANSAHLPRAETAANPRLLAALAYAKRGWAVLPCRPRDKRPATKHGFKDATTERGELVRIWGANGEANVGIATGRLSGIVVLDVDPRNGGDESLAELERVHGPLPETASVATGGGGRHFYFAAPTGAVPSGDLAPGVEIKGDGRYVIAPPSAHPSGDQYRWMHNPNAKLALCPDWVCPRSSEKRSKRQEVVDADAAGTVIGRAFAAVGMLGRRLDGGKRSVVCPWSTKHTTGVAHDSSTVIFPATTSNGPGGFHCSHAHCSARAVGDVLRELERLALRGEEQQAWMAELRRTAKGEVRGSFHNSVLILGHDDRYAGKLRLDEMRGVVALGDVEMSDAAISAIRVDLEKRYAIQPSEADTVRAVQLIASNNAFHPVRDYLKALKWDGVPRLDQVEDPPIQWTA